MKIIDANVERLKTLSDKFKSDIRAKTNELINLYKERKIRNYKTIEKTIITYLLDKKEYKFNKAYDKLKNKFQDVEPVRNRRRVKKTVIKQDVEIQALLYTEPNEDEVEDKQKKHKRGYKHKGLHQVYHGSVNLQNFELTDKDKILLEKYNKKLLTVSDKSLGRYPTEEEKTGFSKYDIYSGT